MKLTDNDLLKIASRAGFDPLENPHALKVVRLVTRDRTRDITIPTVALRSFADRVFALGVDCGMEELEDEMDHESGGTRP
jgi:hypothetical protein